MSLRRAREGENEENCRISRMICIVTSVGYTANIVFRGEERRPLAPDQLPHMR